jgi:hypothetical protein
MATPKTEERASRVGNTRNETIVSSMDLSLFSGVFATSSYAEDVAMRFSRAVASACPVGSSQVHDTITRKGTFSVTAPCPWATAAKNSMRRTAASLMPAL